MTLETSQPAKIQYDCAGGTYYAVPFYFPAETDLKVILTDLSDGADDTLALNTDYTVEGAGESAGGSLTTTEAYPAGFRLTAILDVALTQTTDLEALGPFPSRQVEASLDKLTAIARQHEERFGRCVQYPASATGSETTDAEGYVEDLEAVRAGAEAARTGAQTAQGLAETAQGLAETAQAAAEAAAGDAQSAAAGVNLPSVASGDEGKHLAVKSDHSGYDLVAAPPSLDTANEWTAAQTFDAVALTDGASVAWDLDAAQVASLTLGGNRALANPTHMKDGGAYVLLVRQDGTGGRTLSFGSAYKWPGGAAPSLSAGAGAVDALVFVCDGSAMYGVAQKNFG